MRDLDLLKVTVTRITEEADRWVEADDAVYRVLRLLRADLDFGSREWNLIYDAIKAAYAGEADWSTSDEE